MLYRGIYTTLLSILALVATAQFTQIGNGGFTNTNFGPLRSDTVANYYSRFAMIYPSVTLGDLRHGDHISALAFSHNSFDTMRGSGLVKIYIKATSQTDFGSGSINWLAQSRNGMILVYSGDPYPLIDSEPSSVFFQFNKVNKYTWDTTGGATHLQVLIEYQQTTKQDGSIDWFCENASSVSGFTSANESKYVFGTSSPGLDSITTFSSIIKPTLSIYYPRYNQDLAVKRMYALGTVPLLMQQPDSLKVLIANYGKTTVFNKKVYLNVSGANSFKDSITIPSIGSLQEKFVYFTTYHPTLLGTDTLSIQAEDDSTLSNNVLIKARAVSYNVYSHVDPFSASSGGIGFSGSTGDFLAKFYVNGSSFINQIKVDFTVPGRGFQLGIWDDNGLGNLPGTVLFMSDTSVTISGTFVMPVLPKIQVSGGYYIGIRQTTNTNVAFSFQYETPIRPHVFYFTAPSGDSLWVPFSPGFNFNFNIQPRLQVANDVAVFDISSPANGDTILYHPSDSMPLRAKVINYGFQNQGNFIVRMQIFNRFSQQVFSQDEIISLNADDTATVSFGKFSLYNLGQFSARVTVLLSTDSIVDNNSKTVIFDLIKNRDVGVNRIFFPANGDVFDLNRDTFQPTIRVDNYGAIAMNNFKVRGELVNAKGQILDSDEFTLSLEANLTVIKTFKFMKLTEPGNIVFRAFTLLSNDSFPSNDTAKVTLVSRKVDDVSVLNIITPKPIKYVLGTKIKPYINFKNEGITLKDSILVTARIIGEDGKTIYQDSAIKSLDLLSISQLIFKEMVLDSIGEFRFVAKAYIADDQWHINDTMSVAFSVVTGNDLVLVQLDYPQGIIPVNSASMPPLLLVKNNGFNAISEATVSLNISNNLNAIIYSDTLTVSLDTSEAKVISFKNLDFNNLGDYYVTAVNNWPLEQAPSRYDTIFTTYVTRYTKDLGISAHITPSQNDTLELYESVKPSIQVTNFGLDTIFNASIALTIQNTDGAAVYKDTLMLDRLNPKTAVTLVSNIWFTASWFGDYTFISSLVAADDNIINDVNTTNYLVIRRNDAEVTTIDFPGNGQEFTKGTVLKPQVKITNLGINDLDDILVYCQAFENSVLTYSSSRVLNLKAGQFDQVVFDSTLTSNQNGIVDLAFSVSHASDQLLINDSAFSYVTFKSGAGVQEFNENITKVYPNPFHNRITIESKDYITSIKLLDVLGREVQSTNVNASKIDVPLLLSEGVYILEVVHNQYIEQITIIGTSF